MSGHIIDKENTINALMKINSLLGQALMKIREINEDEQFDFCTNAKLAEEVCKTEAITKEISNIVFQKKKIKRAQIGNLAKLNFVWNMTEENWKNMLLDHKNGRNGKLSKDANTYGSVCVGHVKVDFVHTLCKGDWYCFTNVFVHGIDTGYSRTSDGKPYCLLNESPKVPIRCKTFDSFKKTFEKMLLEFIDEKHVVKIVGGENANIILKDFANKETMNWEF